jgi:probable rRNA maturation factor
MITIEPTAGLESKLSRSGLTSFLNRARVAIGLPGEVEVLLSDDRTLRRLNRSFRGKNKSTDVLSFPTPVEIAHLHAGDLAISLETAAVQAASHGHSLRDEVRILLLHGLLHLSGLDHETDNGEMATREAILRRELRLTNNTLIERTAVPPRGSHPAKKKSSSLRTVPAASKKSLSIRAIKKASMPKKKTARGSK